MNTARWLRSFLFAAPLCLAANPSNDEVSFHPKDGSSLSKTFELSMDVSLDDVTMNVDGNDVSGQIPASEMAASVNQSLTVTDQYVAVAEGRPTELIRTYDDVQVKWEAGDESHESSDGLAKLQSKKVKFKWNADDKSYDVSFQEGEGDAKDLEHLAEDMDLRALLPDRAVKPGDKWQVEAKDLMSVLIAGIRIDKLDTSDADAQAQEVLDEVLPQIKKLGDDVKTSCEYKGSRDVDGKRVAAIAIKIEGKPSLDLVSLIKNLVAKQEGVDMKADVKRASVGLEVAGDGEMLWDLAAGHVHDLHLTSNLKLNVDVDLTLEVQGDEHPVQAAVEASGKGEWKVAVK